MAYSFASSLKSQCTIEMYLKTIILNNITTILIDTIVYPFYLNMTSVSNYYNIIIHWFVLINYNLTLSRLRFYYISYFII